LPENIYIIAQNRAFINRQDVDKEISKEEIAKLQEENRHVNLESDEEIIHAIPQTFRIDNEYEVENPIGMRGRRIEANFHIVVGKGTAIKYIRTAINRAGLEVAELMLEPLASAASTLTFDEKKLGVAIIDIGGGTTDIAIYHDNIVQFTEVIPFGGNAITNDISEGCQILDELAEKLKIDYGYCIQDSSLENEIVSIPGLNGRPAKEISLYTLAGIIQARMEEIIDSALFVIKTSGYAHKLGADIVVTGGGALLKFLPQLLSYKTGKEAKIGTPINYVHYQNYKDFYNPIYATSVGLLMRAAELHKESYVAQSHVEPQVQEPAQQSVASQKIAQQESSDLKKEKPNKLYRMVERFLLVEAYLIPN
jgi:cell division protein FtsA